MAKSDVYTLKTGDLCPDQPADDKYSTLLENIYSCLNAELLELVSSMLDGAEDHLSALIKQAIEEDSEALSIRYNETKRLFDRERSNIDKTFFIALNDHLGPGSRQIRDNEDELSLVAEDEMEEMVMMTTIHSNAMNEFGREISLLQERLEYLRQNSVAIFDKDSLNPHQICEIYQGVLKDCNITTVCRVVLLQYFEQQVISNLGNMYDELNKCFDEAGILLSLKARKAKEKEEGSEKAVVRTVNYYDPQENRSTHFIPRSQDEINYLVTQFMSSGVTSPRPGVPQSFTVIPPKDEKDGKKYYARKDVAKALTKLQNTLLSDNAEKEDIQVNTEEIAKTINSDVSDEQDGDTAERKQVHLLDQRSIDFVGMMFDAITEDESISDVIRDLLMRLQIPVIKAAMLDDDLFNNSNHPTRDTLNLISEVGKGVTEKEDRVYSEIENVVDNILNEYDVDNVSFEKAANDLRKLIDKESEIAKEKERQEHRALLNAQARQVVITEFRTISKNKKVPKAVKPLVMKQWPTLMMNRYMRYGRNSDPWVQSVMLLKLLLRCLQPVNKREQYELLDNNHDALVEAVNDELYDTDQDKKVIDNQILMLRRTFKKMLNDCGFRLMEEDESGALVSLEEVEEYKHHSNTELEADEQREETGEDIKQRISQEVERNNEKIIQLLNDVKPGDWFEIFNGEDKPVRRLKLSVVLNEIAKVVFVDRKGVKVIEKDIEEFAKEMQDNKSRMLADHSTFDHVLGKVINALAA